MSLRVHSPPWINLVRIMYLLVWVQMLYEESHCLSFIHAAVMKYPDKQPKVYFSLQFQTVPRFTAYAHNTCMHAYVQLTFFSFDSLIPKAREL